MKLKHPEISVILPVFNGEKYIAEAIDSILDQTFKNFELIIINDGSTDGTDELLKEYVIKDKRIIYLKQENEGLSRSLNRGLRLARADLVARMDADDVAMSTRLEKQFMVMNEKENVVLVSSNVVYINEEGKNMGESISPTWSLSIKRKLRKGNIIFHPTVMFRKKIALKFGGYDEKVKQYVEDYLLWKRMINEGCFFIIEQPLLRYRDCADSLSRSKEDPERIKILKENGLLLKKSKTKLIFRRILKFCFGKNFFKQVLNIQYLL